MRIKAVEGIKAYNRGADLPGLRLSACLSVYSAVLRVIRTCVRQQISTILWTSGCRGRERERERERGREGREYAVSYGCAPGKDLRSSVCFL